jgi:hypothetical protein
MTSLHNDVKCILFICWIPKALPVLRRFIIEPIDSPILLTCEPAFRRFEHQITPPNIRLNGNFPARNIAHQVPFTSRIPLKVPLKLSGSLGGGCMMSAWTKVLDIPDTTSQIEKARVIP